MKSYIWAALILLITYTTFAQYPEYTRGEIKSSIVKQAIVQHPFIIGLIFSHISSIFIPKKMYPAQLMIFTIPLGIACGSGLKTYGPKLPPKHARKL